ncbi:putative 50S ribosomal protein L7/L12 [Corchorus capsularis]|uniref:Putative 50S ribosomal protein L7/L12 n=1 Tax=Corchorus capsularis TaxID=210143 RepID=A0A1R3HAQ6_COCAP|nr:putative 50S ribosomal protein L7/L12 [Corchorus capsularis]
MGRGFSGGVRGGGGGGGDAGGRLRSRGASSSSSIVRDAAAVSVSSRMLGRPSLFHVVSDNFAEEPSYKRKYICRTVVEQFEACGIYNRKSEGKDSVICQRYLQDLNEFCEIPMYLESSSIFGPRPPSSDKIVELAERIAALQPEERNQIGPVLAERLRHPKLQRADTDGMDLGSQGGGGAGASKLEI